MLQLKPAVVCHLSDPGDMKSCYFCSAWDVDKNDDDFLPAPPRSMDGSDHKVTYARLVIS